MFDKLKCAISIICLAVVLGGQVLVLGGQVLVLGGQVLVLVLGGQVLVNIPGKNLRLFKKRFRFLGFLGF